MTIDTAGTKEFGAASPFRSYYDVLDQYVDPERTFHPTGVYDESLLQTIADRPTCTIVDGIPVTVAVDDAPELIEPDRCEQIVRGLNLGIDRPHIKESLVPGEFLLERYDELGHFIEIGNGESVIFAEFDEVGEGPSIAEKAQQVGIKVTPLAHPVFKTEAGLDFFQASTEVSTTTAGPSLSLSDVVKERGQDFEERTEDGGSIQVRQGGGFSESEQKAIWDLFSKRFQDITDNMPVRIEETEEATRELLNDPGYTFIYKVENDDVISCCAFMSDDPDSYPWISTDFLERQDQKLRSRYGEVPYSVFVPGLAAYKQRGIKASTPVLQKVVDVVAATNHSRVTFRFECTDVSSLYVPNICREIWATNPNYSSAELSKLAGKKYVLLELPKAKNE